MQNVAYLIHVGSAEDVAEVKDNPEWAIVHACKTAHKAALGYEKSLPGGDPNYLVYQPLDNDREIFLNLVDMKNELLPQYTDPILRSAFQFMDANTAKGRKILVHCDQGNSRGPSVAMAFLSRNGDFNYANYDSSSEQFKERYEQFAPGDGIKAYMSKHWQRIIGF